jgi:AAA+ superfamily predicted ATPase
MALTSWSWRKNYRVWEANRKVFAYPENWSEPDQRPSRAPQIELTPIVEAAKSGRAAVLLKTGDPTAALLAARALAADLGRNVYRVGLSQVVSKYIGETEKNLELVFAAAAAADAIIFFDEADALFGQRTAVKDSHDRFANQETTYLLQRIETFDGVAILASNANQTTGVALSKRFAFVLDLPA